MSVIVKTDSPGTEALKPFFDSLTSFVFRKLSEFVKYNFMFFVTGMPEIVPLILTNRFHIKAQGARVSHQQKP
jgi:hypothetical protein